MQEIDHVTETLIENICYFADACFINLTMNTANFSKTCLSMAKDLLVLHTPEYDPLITDALVQSFRVQVKHMEDTMKNKDFYREVGYSSFLFWRE